MKIPFRKKKVSIKVQDQASIICYSKNMLMEAGNHHLNQNYQEKVIFKKLKLQALVNIIFKQKIILPT